MKRTKIREDGLELYREGYYLAALETFQDEKTDPAKDPELAYFMALCHIRLDEPDKAAPLLRKILIRGDDHWGRRYQSHMLLAWIYVNAEDIKSAEQQLQMLFGEGFESAQAWAALGYCYWKGRKIESALKAYRSALEVDESNANAANGLGYLLADSGEDPEEAVTFCRRALETDPENTAYMDSLGWALFRAGHPDEAVRYLMAALVLRPEDVTIKQHLEAVKADAQNP